MRVSFRLLSGPATLALLGGMLAWGGACEAPPHIPETHCVDACAAKAHARCATRECERGCRFILDRLVEREGDKVIACVGKAAACDDDAWASCAARVGVHEDGGPPVPKTRADDDPASDDL